VKKSAERPLVGTNEKKRIGAATISTGTSAARTRRRTSSATTPTTASTLKTFTTELVGAIAVMASWSTELPE
jgi:hypothetical protein